MLATGAGFYQPLRMDIEKQILENKARLTSAQMVVACYGVETAVKAAKLAAKGNGHGTISAECCVPWQSVSALVRAGEAVLTEARLRSICRPLVALE